MQHDHQTGAQVRPGIHDFDAALGTILGIVLIGRINRRPLLLTGFTGVAAGHAILALSFLLPESAFRSYLILAAMLVVVFFMQTFIGTLVWLLLSEIFPMTIRGFAMGIAVFVLWTVNAAISFAFPPLVAALGATPTFGLFALINVGSILFVKKFAPETRGRSLEELEDDIRTHAPAHLVPRGPGRRPRGLSGPGTRKGDRHPRLVSRGVAGARASAAGQTSRGKGRTTSRSSTDRPTTTSRAPQA